MTQSLKYFAPAAIALFGIVLFSTVAHANPLRFPIGVGSAAATTTLTYLSTAGATTTVAAYDTYDNNGVSGGGSTQAMDMVAVLMQTTATSSSSVYYATVEWANGQGSDDCIATPTVCDWYSEENIVRTSTGTATITNPNIYTFTALGTARENRVIASGAPLRYMRVRAWVAGANGAIWAYVQPQKQNN